MERARPSDFRLVLVGAGCLAAGIAVGCVLPGAARAPIWSAAAGEDSARGPLPATSACVPTFADVAERVGPGVVAVRAYLSEPVVRDSYDGALTGSEAANAPGAGVTLTAEQSGRRNGSGFIVNEAGLVVTSRHVVADSFGIDVIVPNNGTCRAVLVGEDVASDLALLRLVEPPDGLAALPLGDSEGLRAGDWIVAVGNPFGFAQTVTAGVVSFVGRHLAHTDFGVTNDFLQISAPVNPGSSGSPVVDLHGRVVGVTTQAATSAQGISFAVPSRTLKWALEAMEREPDGKVHRGYLGIEFATRRGLDDAGSCAGAVITRVAEGEPAFRAGLRRGDVVLRVDGEPVRDAKALHESIVRRNPGTRIAVQLLRDGRVQDPIEAVLGEVGGPKVTGPSN